MKIELSTSPTFVLLEHVKGILFQQLEDKKKLLGVEF